MSTKLSRKQFVARYQGRSLAWVRAEMLHETGPRFGSAYEMAQAYKGSLVAEPRRGMVCFFGDRAPGDIGYYLGSGMVRMLSPDAREITMPLRLVKQPFIGAMDWPSS